ncbi:hypothetical protein FrCorBMG51_20975 [Protofrankia coriariae]|uniref:Uncharacterized protein n=1 Tax=Protofrankia coriariae TaxID=1562887 RepID=A0ABR5EZW2_9ACTN|nr:hypothetical protein FrCorBMG51_20975 [Protofrankia coriariae]
MTAAYSGHAAYGTNTVEHADGRNMPGQTEQPSPDTDSHEWTRAPMSTGTDEHGTEEHGTEAGR